MEVVNLAERKKDSTIGIIDILKKYTDKNHYLTHQQIIDKLRKDYGVDLGRKAVGRKLELIEEVGYELDRIPRKGVALINRDFEESEIRMLIDCVLCCRHIPSNYSKDLITKLTSLESNYFKNNVKHIRNISQFSKLDNKEIFNSIELIEEAIENHLVINYKFNKYDTEGNLHYSSSQYLSPYAMLLHNQKYYLMGYSDYHGKIVFNRIDRITEMKITTNAYHDVTTIPGYENGIDYKELSVSRPYFYNDKLEEVTMIIDNSMIDQIFDWFGTEAKFYDLDHDDKHKRVRVRTSPNAILCWALQYLSSVKIIEPLSLKMRIEETLEKGLEKYKSNQTITTTLDDEIKEITKLSEDDKQIFYNIGPNKTI